MSYIGTTSYIGVLVILGILTSLLVAGAIYWVVSDWRQLQFVKPINGPTVDPRLPTPDIKNRRLKNRDHICKCRFCQKQTRARVKFVSLVKSCDFDFCYINRRPYIFTRLGINQGPVIQNIVSLTSSLVVKMLTVPVSTISNSQVFLLKKCE